MCAQISISSSRPLLRLRDERKNETSQGFATNLADYLSVRSHVMRKPNFATRGETDDVMLSREFWPLASAGAAPLTPCGLRTLQRS